MVHTLWGLGQPEITRGSFIPTLWVSHRSFVGMGGGDSTYPLLNRCLERAYTEMIAEKKVDLMKGDDREKPDWGHYTWRRLAAESCQAAFARGECSEPDVDLLMGWRLKKWEKQMRLHYSERGVRTSRAHLIERI